LYQRAESREQRAESREQRAESRGQRAESREQRAESRENEEEVYLSNPFSAQMCTHSAATLLVTLR
jgi:hypothetical protein